MECVCVDSLLGRRISAQSPGDLIAQQNPDVPVVKQGHWTQKTYAELDKQDDVELLRVENCFLCKFRIKKIAFFFLKNSLDELRLSQQPEITRPISSTATDRLGQHSKTVEFHFLFGFIHLIFSRNVL